MRQDRRVDTVREASPAQKGQGPILSFLSGMGVPVCPFFDFVILQGRFSSNHLSSEQRHSLFE